MRYLILSDIHANLEALDAVLAAESPASYDAVLVLGDLVGYGPDPNVVVERVRALNPHVIRGNHDKVACGLESADSFNPRARRAAEWTRDTLTPSASAYLRALPAGPLAIDEGLEICHGAPFDEDFYLYEEREIRRSFRAMRHPVCLFGHTHVPAVWSNTPHGPDLLSPGDRTETTVPMDPGVSYLVNPGSVGQPRDGDPRAACARMDTEARTIVLRRVPYPVETTQAKIFSAGLPAALATRLERGR
jgi:diadenosine tetraphosphatase ApaH/serine/threonine PP2A family protein phosphatase